MSLSTALIVKGQSYFGWTLLYLSKMYVADQAWKSFNTKFEPQWKDGKSSYQVRQILALFCNLVALILG